MGKRDLRNIMEDYSQKDMSDNTYACHLDNLRAHGVPHATAQGIARKAADVTQKSLDGQQDALANGKRRKRAEIRKSPTEQKPPAYSWMRFNDGE